MLSYKFSSTEKVDDYQDDTIESPFNQLSKFKDDGDY